MMYRIIKYTVHGLVALETCSSYSEAELKRIETVELFPNDWIEIVSEADLVQSCPTD